MRRINRFTLALTALLLAALACNLPQPTQPASEQPNAAFTAAAQTVAAQLTQSALTLNAPPTTGNVPPPQNTAIPTNTNIPPTIAPLSTNTNQPTATQECDKAQFVSDITFPDNSILTPGQIFTKIWRIKNIGTCSWTPSYTIVYDHGEQMSGPSSQAMIGNTNPGQTVDISINLVAPVTANDYVGYWKIRNAAGVTFTQFYVDIKVVGGGGGAFAVTTIDYILSTWSDAGHTNCPRVIAKITVNGPGTVTFKWTRADSPSGGAVETVSFAAAGSKNVRYDWNRGSTWAGTATWVGIFVVTPNNQSFGHLNFNTACTFP